MPRNASSPNAGFEGTSIGDVEQAAGFTWRGGTLYKHFDSKEALFAAIIDRYLEATSSDQAVGAWVDLALTHMEARH